MTIIGILLSVAMFTAVTTTISSIYNLMLEATEMDDGCWHISVSGADDRQIQQAAADKEVEKSAFLWNLSYAKLRSARKETTPYLYICGYEGDFPELMSVQMISGRLPENSSEIILSKKMTELFGIDLKSGDTLTLKTGIRRRNGTGNAIWQEEPYRKNQEMFVDSGEKTYHVVGLYQSADLPVTGGDIAGCPALTKKDASVTGNIHTAYVTLHDPGHVNKLVKKWAKAMGDDAVSTNSYYLKLQGETIGESMGKSIFSLMVILILIIMFGSIALIYNSFSISVNERKKQYGLLSSIGATRKQLKKSVLFEALSVSIIGIPLGILAGITGMTITFYLLRNVMTTLFFNGDGPVLHMSASLWAIAIAAGAGFITVFISAYIPAIKALKINTIDAIRQTNDVVIKPKKLKTSRLTLRIFGLEGMLASKNYKRNKRKYRATVFSLFVSIVLFISASSFCDYLKTAADTEVQNLETDYRISIAEIQPGKETDEIYRKIQASAGITAHSCHYTILNTESEIAAKYLTEEFLHAQDDGTNYKKTGKITAKNFTLAFVEDSIYKKYLEDNRLDVSRCMNPENPAAVLYNNGIDIDPATGAPRRIHVCSGKPEPFPLYFLGAFIDTENTKKKENVPVYDGFEKLGTTTVTVGELCGEIPYCLDIEKANGYLLMYPASALDAVCPPEMQKKLQENFNYNISLNSDNTNITELDTAEILSSIKYPYSTMNIAYMMKSNRAVLIIINVFSYGFILLISLIAAANVFNTISTNVSLRRREFAILRSVGMTQKSFRKMSYFECLLYGIKGLAYGLPAAIGVTFLIWRAAAEGSDIHFYIPWFSIVIAIGSVFAVVFSTMMYSVSKTKKDNILDTLKQENY